jgi:hypothetical protein
LAERPIRSPCRAGGVHNSGVDYYVINTNANRDRALALVSERRKHEDCHAGVGQPPAAFLPLPRRLNISW